MFAKLGRHPYAVALLSSAMSTLCRLRYCRLRVVRDPTCLKLGIADVPVWFNVQLWAHQV